MLTWCCLVAYSAIASSMLSRWCTWAAAAVHACLLDSWWCGVHSTCDMHVAYSYSTVLCSISILRVDSVWLYVLYGIAVAMHSVAMYATIYMLHECYLLCMLAHAMNASYDVCCAYSLSTVSISSLRGGVRAAVYHVSIHMIPISREHAQSIVHTHVSSASH
jgi:hypothetical protein